MVLRIPMLPIASVSGPPQLLLSNDDWQRVEEAYGLPLQAEVRELIVEATRKFLVSGEAEVTARPLAEASRRLDEIRKASIKFQNVLINHPQDDKWDARHHAHHLINRFLNYESIEYRDDDTLPETDPLNKDSDKGAVADFRSVFLAEVGSLISACDQALKHLENNLGPTKGDAWDQWVCRLSTIVEANNLPKEVRKDFDAESKPSAFVKLIRELQAFIPEAYRRPSYSKTNLALAEAIARTRQGSSGHNTFCVQLG